MSVTFKLRRSATFHDGAPVTADDVKWSLARAVTVGGFRISRHSRWLPAASRSPSNSSSSTTTRSGSTIYARTKLTLPDLAVVVPAVFSSKLTRSHASDKDTWAM